jgi:hypothetical protein
VVTVKPVGMLMLPALAASGELPAFVMAIVKLRDAADLTTLGEMDASNLSPGAALATKGETSKKTTNPAAAT